MEMGVIKSETLQHHALCAYLRTIVFIQEQNVSLEEEFETDEDEAVYFLGMYDESPVATSRYRILDDNKTVKIERVAVLSEHRGLGYGKKLTLAAVSDAQTFFPSAAVVATAQDHAIPFYEDLGFVVAGEGFVAAGIPHHTMMLEKRNK